MSFPQNTVVFVTVFLYHTYLAEVVKALNTTLKDLEIMNKTKLQLPDLGSANANTTKEYNKDNFRHIMKRMYDEVLLVAEAKDMPFKKIFGMYTKFWTDLLSPNEETMLYPNTFAEFFKKLYLTIKE